MEDHAHLDDLLGRTHVRWVWLPALEGPVELSCIDGRHQHGIVGAPGGNAGEVVLWLAAAESLGQRPFSVGDVQALVDDVLDRYGHFYLHTDRDALEQLGETLRGDAAFRWAADELRDVDAFVRHPPARCREALLAYLKRPEHIGCGHLRCMSEAPEVYGVRRDLLRAVVRAFFVRLWDGHPHARFVVLEGVHEEVAVLVVDSPDEGSPEGRFIPVLDPQEGAPSVFTLHRPAVSHKRDVGARWLSETLGRVRPGARPDVQALRRRIEELGERQLQATVRTLAPDLPTWVVRYDGARRTLDAA